jgi:hypothetical protein
MIFKTQFELSEYLKTIGYTIMKLNPEIMQDDRKYKINLLLEEDSGKKYNIELDFITEPPLAILVDILTNEEVAIIPLKKLTK